MSHNQRMMLPVEKALWYVESHFCEEIRLAGLAEICEVSPTYLSRLFPLALGYSLKEYLRRRRLTEAARCLAAGAPDILEVALRHGYGSHEAFTRAFRDEFAVTPESVRARGDVQHLILLEAIRMNIDQIKDIQPIRMETGRALTVGGLCEHYEGDTAGIPGQWQKLVPYLGNVAQQVGECSYGVCHNFKEGGVFDYLCGVEVRSSGGLPDGWRTVVLPENQTYAVFLHDEHVSLIQQTCHSIFAGWLPRSAYKSAEGPFFERYGPEFDGRTGRGGLEVWVPVE